MKKSIDLLKDVHKDKPIIVMGAGEDLSKDLNSLPYDLNECITISANNKPLKVFPEPNYIFVISKKLGQEVWETVDPSVTIRISTLERFSDYIVNRRAIWYGAPGAGALATSLACHLGGNPIILCGFDLFRKSKHCDGIERNVVEKTLDINIFMDRWVNLLKFNDNSKNIRAMPHSPLSEIFGKFI